MNNVVEEFTEYRNVRNYLHKTQYKSLLRFLTCGSVDDGKSTLIGRLLYDSSQIYDDQLESLCNDSKYCVKDTNQLNFASLVDGLQDERTQGITIDVAYRYFSTENRKFIIADAPGHEQYTRNMATAASTSHLAVLLVDVCKGIRNQTRRHTFISTLFGIKNLIIVVNKMDLVNYDHDIFEKVKKDYLIFIKRFTMELNVQFIPISALHGDNIICCSKNMSWYTGLTLINILDTIKVVYPIVNKQHLRFPVQYVNYNYLDFRGYSGTVASGEICVGDKVKIFPSGNTSLVHRIVTFQGDLVKAYAGDPITVVLEEDLDISRGNLLLSVDDHVIPVNSAQVDVIWMSTENLVKGTIFNVQIAHRRIKACVKILHYQVDVDNVNYCVSDSLSLNGIGLIELVFDEPILLDIYSFSPITGGMIFIDLNTNFTLGAGMVRLPLSGLCNRSSNVDSNFELELHAFICRHFPHWNVNTLLRKSDGSSSIK